MNPNQMQQMQIQNMMSQLQNLYQQFGATSPALADQAATPVLQSKPVEAKPQTIPYCHGIDGAKEERNKLKPGESMIIMDDSENVFYAIARDKEGKVPKVKVGRFTIEDEPDPPKYVTQTDLDAFKADLLAAIKGGKE